jgi:hypothetical protein
MTYQHAAISDNPISLPTLPAWVTSDHAETLENVAFRSGGVLMVLDRLVTDKVLGVPVKLLAKRLALKAATATSKLEGRLAREADIRDAWHLTPPGEARGPDGDLLAFWRETACLRPTGRYEPDTIQSLAGQALAGTVGTWLRIGESRARTHGPLAGCVSVLRAVMEVDDRAERVACLLSDIILAQVLRWTNVLPVSAACLTKASLRDLLAGGPRAELAVQASILASIEETVRLARDLAHRAVELRTVAPKLRARGSDAAVALFLGEDAIAPSSMLSPMIQGTAVRMTGRAARRFCDRLVDLGVARELTGRATFRLYGL